MKKTVSATAVKYSQISRPPAFTLPAGSCDCHHHIYDSRFPYAPDDKRHLPDATAEDYRLFKEWLGFSRHVLVQPSSYGTDNACLLDALRSFGDCARGEAVVDISVTDRELDRLARAGVNGIRFNLGAGHATTADMILPLAERIAERDWHVQIHAPADFLKAIEDILKKIKTRVVIDHYFRLPLPDPIRHPAWKLAWELINQGNYWVKISSLYQESQRADVEDIGALITGFLREAEDRVLWGSDWPHPGLTSARKPQPDDALILSKIYAWAGSDRIRKKLFVTNPAEVYQFD